MDLEKLLKQSQDNKRESDERRAEAWAQTEAAFRAYISEFQQRILDALTDVSGIGPLTWQPERIEPDSNAGGLASPLRGMTESNQQPLVVQVSVTLVWDYLGISKHGTVRDMKVIVYRTSEPAKKGTGYHHIPLSHDTGENQYLSSGEFRNALAVAVRDLGES